MITANRVWIFGDDINTDVLFPGRYTYRLMSDGEMGEFAMIDYAPEFNKNAAPGDIIVGGRNWGCGSSREQAAKCLKAKGISAIIAKGFARIFYRNALNEGLLTIVCPEAVDDAEEGCEISVDMERSEVIVNSIAYPFAPYPDFVQGLVQSGGLVPYVRERLIREGRIQKYHI